MIVVELGADIRIRWWVRALAVLPLPWSDRAIEWMVKHGVDFRAYTVREDGTKDYFR